MNSKTTVRIVLAAVGAVLVITAHDVVQDYEFSPDGQTVTSINFLKLEDNDTRIPPDTMGAVGTNYVVTMLNSQVRIQTRMGATNSTVTLNQWWSSVGPFQSAIGVTDPRIDPTLTITAGLRQPSPIPISDRPRSSWRYRGRAIPRADGIA